VHPELEFQMDEDRVPNRQLTPAERETLFTPLIAEVRGRLIELSDGDIDLHWALRRKLAKELTYDERSKPMQRRALKLRKRRDQNDRRLECGEPLPVSGAVLDRLQAMASYTAENTRLICQPCDTRVQRERRYA
jgi:hypothetical protein